MRRGARLLFEGLSFSLPRGEIIQLIGPNGSGKSTLLRLIAGFSKAESGTITGCQPDDDGAPRLHYHGHRDGLRDALSVEENLTFFASLNSVPVSTITAALEQLGLVRLARLPVGVLSEGQRRRVALSRLILVPRPIWLLDEPLAALDAQASAMVEAMLRSHRDTGGMAIVATHQPIEAATRILDLARPKVPA